MAALMGADGSPKKVDGKWVISRKMENLNAWDKDNSMLKMAQKRAMVGATLTACAASDIFTQDVEDMVIEAPEKPVEPSPAKTAPKVDTETGEILESPDELLARQRAEIGKTLYWIAGDGEKAKDLLEEITFYQKTGKGKRELADLSPKQVPVIHRKVMDAYQQFQAEQGAANDSPVVDPADAAGLFDGEVVADGEVV